MSDCQKGRNNRIAGLPLGGYTPLPRCVTPGEAHLQLVARFARYGGDDHDGYCVLQLEAPGRFLDDGVDAFYKNKPSKTKVRLQRRMREWGSKGAATSKRDRFAQEMSTNGNCNAPEPMVG